MCGIKSLSKFKISTAYLIIWMMMMIFFFHRFIIQFGAPDEVKYLLDFLNILLFLCAINKKSCLNYKEKKYFFCYVLIFLLGTASALVNVVDWGWNVSYYFFDCRAIIRYIVFFYSCRVLLTNHMINKLFNWILGFHVINSIYIVYQFFTLEVATYWMRGDNLNGFFGVATGGNTYVNVLIIAVTLIILNRWLKKECSLKSMLFFIGMNLAIATLIELKAYYIELLIICAFFSFPYLKRFTSKQLIIGGCFICAGLITFVFLIQWLNKLYPWMKGTFTSITNIFMASSSYNNTGNIGRLSFLKDTYIQIFHKNIFDMILGVGIGTASTSGEMTKFALTYYDKTHYSWLSSAYILVEMGIVGLSLYLYSFMLLFQCDIKNPWNQITKISCIISVILLIYNETFRTEAGYIMFFLISLAYIKNNEA